MSWNWFSSASSHSSSSWSWGYSNPLRIAAREARNSASCSRCSLRRLPCLVPGWAEKVPRCSSRYSSPFHTGASGYSSRARSKNCSEVPNSTFGEPSRSAARRPAAIISRVGPPPPSPQPNRSMPMLERPFSLKLRSK